MAIHRKKILQGHEVRELVREMGANIFVLNAALRSKITPEDVRVDNEMEHLSFGIFLSAHALVQ